MLASRVLAASVVHSSRRFASSKVAVVLSGSGVYDGSEIHEAAACLSHLTRHGIEPVCFAPDKEQMHAVDHVSGNPSEDKRNVLSESGRIARGKVQPLSALRAQDVGAVVFPGGFGVAKNLSTFAVDGPNCQIDPIVEKTIKEFVSAKKPLAFCCIAPILAARLINGVEITLGMDKDDGSWPYAGSVEVARSWGANHKNCRVNEVCVDEKNLVVTTPAFMYNTEKFHEIYDGVGLMIGALKKLMR